MPTRHQLTGCSAGSMKIAKPGSETRFLPWKRLDFGTFPMEKPGFSQGAYDQQL